MPGHYEGRQTMDISKVTVRELLENKAACDAMNAALPADFGWQWTTDDPATPPVLVKK